MPVHRYGAGHVENLVRLRRQLEPDGRMVALQGSRRDTYPSGMARDMGAGMKVYVLRLGLPGRPDLVGTLDDAPPEQMATVDEQRQIFKAWLAERSTRLSGRQRLRKKAEELFISPATLRPVDNLSLRLSLGLSPRLYVQIRARGETETFRGRQLRTVIR